MTASSSEEHNQNVPRQRQQYRVDEKKVRAAYLLVKARKLCPNFKTHDAVGYSEILSELGHFDLAIQLALAHD
jgi:hypothetical protein